MSTLATADLGPSDDEADGDFVLPAAKPKKTKGKRARRGSASSSGSSDEEGGDADVEEVTRLKAEALEVEAAARKLRAAEAFRAMQEEAKGPTQPVESKEEVEMVEVKRPRRFAGETIYETVKLPKTDPEAVKYLAQLEKEKAEPKSAESNGASSPGPATSSTPTEAVPSSASPAPASSSSAPPPKRPIRKRPRPSLEAMSAALDKGKKMTTLEKSQMDWNSHMAKETKVAEELEQHRRSGGYLEKQAFLDRVSERAEERRDSGSSSRRR